MHDHDHHHWEDDGGRPERHPTVEGPADPAADDAARQVARHGGHVEPYTPHFGTLPAKPHCELPDGETYRRAIDGG